MTRQIIITPVLNGFVADVGCQRVVFTDKQTMLAQLSEYYDKPEEVEKRFIATAINKVEGPQIGNTADCATEASGVLRRR